MSLADFKDLMAVVQSLILTLAIMVGGVWSLYIFIRLRYIEKAKAELRELEQKTREHAVIEVNLEAVQLDTGDGGPRVISATAVLKNSGNRNIHLDFHEARWNTARVNFDRSGGFILGDERTSDFDFGGHWVRVGGVVRFPTVFNVPEQGIYRVEFAVPVAPSDVLSSPGRPEDEESSNWWWIGRKYLAVV
jgi:hypothetical protein